MRRSAASVELDELEQLDGARRRPRSARGRTAGPAGRAARARSAAGRARPPGARRRSCGARRRARAATSTPATRALPAVIERSVVSILTVVDLPAPFGPRKPNTSPASTRRSTPRTASTVSERLRYVFIRPSASTAASMSTRTPLSLASPFDGARREKSSRTLARAETERRPIGTMQQPVILASVLGMWRVSVSRCRWGR